MGRRLNVPYRDAFSSQIFRMCGQVLCPEKLMYPRTAALSLGEKFVEQVFLFAVVFVLLYWCMQSAALKFANVLVCPDEHILVRCIG